MEKLGVTSQVGKGVFLNSQIYVYIPPRESQSDLHFNDS